MELWCHAWCLIFLVLCIYMCCNVTNLCMSEMQFEHLDNFVNFVDWNTVFESFPNDLVTQPGHAVRNYVPYTTKLPDELRKTKQNLLTKSILMKIQSSSGTRHKYLGSSVIAIAMCYIFAWLVVVWWVSRWCKFLNNAFDCLEIFTWPIIMLCTQLAWSHTFQLCFIFVHVCRELEAFVKKGWQE